GGAVVQQTHRTGSLQVAAVQGGGRRGLRALYRNPTDVFEAQLRASDGVRPPVDLVLWPEDVIDTDRVAGSPENLAMASLARRLDATVVAGIVEDAGPDHFANAAAAWAPDGDLASRYAQVHR